MGGSFLFSFSFFTFLYFFNFFIERKIDYENLEVGMIDISNNGLIA